MSIYLYADPPTLHHLKRALNDRRFSPAPTIASIAIVDMRAPRGRRELRALRSEDYPRIVLLDRQADAPGVFSEGATAIVVWSEDFSELRRRLVGALTFYGE